MKIDGQHYISHVYNNDASDGVNINAVKPIAEAEYEGFLSQIRLVENYHASQNVVKSVTANRNDVLTSIVEMAAGYLNSDIPPEQIMKFANFDISRRFANMCSLFRSFIDHFDRYFVHSHGKESAEYKGWKAIQAHEYDSFFSYKIIYHMRNYIQHYDMPPLKISISENANEEGISTSISVDIDELSKDKEIKRKLSTHNDITSKKLALFNIIDEWDSSFRRIVVYANRVRIKEALPSAFQIVKLREELNLDQIGGLAIIWLPKVDKKPDKLNLVLQHIPEQAAKDLIEEDAEILGALESG